MIRFISARERRLWICTLVVVSAIYSTLGLARTLSDALGDKGFGVSLFLLGCFLALASIVIHGLKPVRSATEIGVVLGIMAAYLLVFVRMSIPTERSHIIEYGVVALFMYEALKERTRHGYRIPFVGLLTILVTGLIGVVDECIQFFIPNRTFDYRDMLFNILAAAMAVTACAALRWVRRRSEQGSLASRA